MSVIGIVSEYNPFHYGHKYHIEETKRLIGEDSTVVCVMSGDFVQRGEAAVYSKFTRAKAAIKCGADLVLELPLPYCLASAEGFAKGAVSILGDIGVVSHLSFGSESGDVSELEFVADKLLSREFDEEIKKCLDSNRGISFAAARQLALEAIAGEKAALIESGNNILGVEYIKAIRSMELNIKPLTIIRRGAGHDELSADRLCSAAAIRKLMTENAEISDYIPHEAWSAFSEESPALMTELENPILSRLKMLPLEVYSNLPDIEEGLDKRLFKAAMEAGSLSELYETAKSKRYAMSRIRRLTMCAALGISADMQKGKPAYTRVLAANEKGCRLLREISEKSSMPVITKPASVKGIGGECERQFELCSSAHDLYVLAYSEAKCKKGGEDWRKSPYIM